MSNKASAWIEAARPKTLPASIGPVLLGISMAPHEQIIKALPIAILTLICAISLQVATNLVNDYYDSVRGLDDHNRLGPDRALQMGLLTKAQLKKGFLGVLVFSLVLGIALMMRGGTPIISIGIASIIMAYAYTGGPFPLSYFGLGEVLALIFFGPVPVWGAYYLITLQADTLPLLVGFIPGFISLSLMAINNLRDNVNDKAKGKNTLATIFGEGFGRVIVLAGISISVIMPTTLFFLFDNYAFLAAGLVSILFYKNWKIVLNGEITSELNTTLANTGKYLFINCLLCSVGFFTI